MKEIGGYFNLELNNRGSFLHDDGILLNSCRNALELVLRSIGGMTRLFIPYFTCDSVMEPIKKLGLDYSFYEIDENLEIKDIPEFKPGEYLVYTDYFGVKDGYVRALVGILGSRLIVDNAQAFFADKLGSVRTVYSPRKFVGVPDGGIAYTNGNVEGSFERDKSFDRCGHLLKRYDCSALDGYKDFQSNDEKLVGQPIREMSELTKALLKNIDFEDVKRKRLANFELLHTELGALNELNVQTGSFASPLVYPYKMRNGAELRKKLISEKVFVATYWPNVFEWCSEDQLEYQLAKNILALPIDQRCDKSDMERIVKIINGN